MTNRMIRGLLLLLAITLGTWASAPPLAAQESESKPAAQEKEARGAPKTTKVIELKHIRPSQVEELMGGAGVRVRRTRALPVVTIEGEPDAVLAAEHAIRELDIPRMGTSAQGSENVEIVFHLLGAGLEPAESEGVVTDRLMSVVEELKGKFPYRSFQLLETGSLRVRTQHRTSTKGFLPGIPGASRELTIYSFQVRVREVLERQDKHLIVLEKLILYVRVPVLTDNGEVRYEELEIRSEVDVLEGKTVVVGKTSVRGPIRGLFLILTANVVE
jgi:hypothetical protein